MPGIFFYARWVKRSLLQPWFDIHLYAGQALGWYLQESIGRGAMGGSRPPNIDLRYKGVTQQCTIVFLPLVTKKIDAVRSLRLRTVYVLPELGSDDASVGRLRQTKR